nr:RING-H2 finger protein ATL65-like [Arachis hypogaea]
MKYHSHPNPPSPPLLSPTTTTTNVITIKTIPFSFYAVLYTSELNDIFRRSSSCRVGAICCFEFEEDDYVRTLPLCSQTFHVDCIDAWLRSHTSCPLYRAGVLSAALLFAPMFAARIRPSLDADEYGSKSAGEVKVGNRSESNRGGDGGGGDGGNGGEEEFE